MIYDSSKRVSAPFDLMNEFESDEPKKQTTLTTQQTVVGTQAPPKPAISGTSKEEGNPGCARTPLFPTTPAMGSTIGTDSAIGAPIAESVPRTHSGDHSGVTVFLAPS